MVKQFLSAFKKSFLISFDASYRISYLLSAKLVSKIVKDEMLDFVLHRMLHVAEDQGMSMFDLSLNQFCWTLSELLKNKEIVRRIPDDIIWNHNLMMRIFIRAKVHERYLREVSADALARAAMKATEKVDFNPTRGN